MSARTWTIIVGAIALVLVGIVFFPQPLPAILLPAEEIFRIGGFPVTNTVVAAWLTLAFWLVFGWRATRSMQLVPSGAQNFLEAVVEFLLGTSESVAGKSGGRRFFPVAGTIFLFIITSNWFGLLPGFGTIGLIKEHHGDAPGVTVQQVASGLAVVPFGRPAKPASEAPDAKKDDHAVSIKEDPGVPVGHKSGELFTAEFVPIFRSVNTDLNMTLALGLLAFIAIEYWGVSALGAGTYLSRFVNFSNPISFALGIIELIAEFARIISFTFRLFGNVFAGEVLLGVIGFLVPWLAALPFYALELFVGFIQAAVFAMLVLVFGALAITHHGDHKEAHEAHH